MHRVRVIVVDEHPDHVEMLSMLFESLGCVVLAATNADDARELIERHHPDAMVIDDDVEARSALIRAARDANPLGVFVACLTAWDRNLHVNSANCDVRLLKPYDFEQVRAAMSDFIAGREMQKKRSNGSH